MSCDSHGQILDRRGDNFFLSFQHSHEVEGVMVNKRRMRWLLAGTVLGTSWVALPALAQDAKS